ncbi:MAG: YCF48-related protein [Ignavibacteriaceae bacterium]
MIKVFKALFYICFIYGLTLTTLSQTNPWKKIQSPVNSTLRRLTFVNSLTGWAAGENGTIIRTTDGGNNWEVQNSTIQTFITDIFFINIEIGWATTIMDTFPFKTVILKTTNGGSNWFAEDFQDSSALMRTIFFFDSLNGFIGGSYIAHTSDGGTSWTRAIVDSNMISGFPVYEFNFYNRQFGFACGGRIDIAGVVWRTTNFGLNWAAQGISPDEIFDIFILDSLNAISLSGDPEGFYGISKLNTSDAGLNWNFEDLFFYGLSFTIDFRTYNEGWSASGYKFLFTSDRGETWSEVETPDSAVIYDLQFVDARYGYAVGQDGVILKFGLENEPTPTKEFILYQNYPNPFNPSTKIKFTIPMVETNRNASLLTTLRVYDVLGNEIAKLVNEEKSAGIYEVEFIPRGLVSGVYFYQLEAGDPSISSGQSFIQTKKMVYLR